MTVVPFRRSKPQAPPPVEQPAPRCSECGWKMPANIRADRAAAPRQLLLYVDCPECGESLLLLVEFT